MGLESHCPHCGESITVHVIVTEYIYANYNMGLCYIRCLIVSNSIWIQCLPKLSSICMAGEYSVFQSYHPDNYQGTRISSIIYQRETRESDTHWITSLDKYFTWRCGNITLMPSKNIFSFEEDALFSYETPMPSGSSRDGTTVITTGIGPNRKWIPLFYIRHRYCFIIYLLWSVLNGSRIYSLWKFSYIRIVNIRIV